MRHKRKPTNIGDIFDNYQNGNHSDVRAAFVGLAAVDAAVLTAELILYAANLDGAASWREALDLADSIRRWNA